MLRGSGYGGVLSQIKELHAQGRFGKLNPRADGPFRILKKINDNAYKVELPGHYGVSSTFNVADLSPYTPDADFDDDSWSIVFRGGNYDNGSRGSPLMPNPKLSPQKCETRNLISKNKEKDIGKILTIIKKKGKSKARKNNNEYEGDDDQLYSLSQGDSEDDESVSMYRLGLLRLHWASLYMKN
ncbi:hypothetical protein Tco_0105279 [Tanacetum coccineum]